MKLIQLLQKLEIKYECIDYEDLDLEIELYIDRGVDGCSVGKLHNASIDYSASKITLIGLLEELR